MKALKVKSLLSVRAEMFFYLFYALFKKKIVIFLLLKRVTRRNFTMSKWFQSSKQKLWFDFLHNNYARNWQDTSMLLEKVLLWFLGPTNKYSPRDIIPLTNSCLSKLPCGYLILVRKRSPCEFSSCLCCCFQPKVLLAIWILSFKGAFFAVDWALQRVLNNSQRTMLSRGRMIWLLGHPFTPLSRQ
jgi:hypothetical protein